MALQNSDANARQQERKTLLVAALMCAIALAALDATIVATALPTIVGNLGGLSLFSWVFSIYLLASTVTVPLYGKLADLYGRKPVVLFGCSVFLLGSICCGVSQNMEQLIISRAIQGLGAGAVQPVTMTIIGDIFTMEERVEIARAVFKDQSNVEVDTFDGLLVDYMERHKADVIVRGLPAVSDFEFEFSITAMNQQLDRDIETVFLMADPRHLAIASKLVKEIAVLGGDDAFISPLLALGAQGAILASAHIQTAAYASLIAHWHSGDVKAAREVGDRLARLSMALFAEPNPTVVKAVLHAQGRIPTPAVRLPLLPAARESVEPALSELR